MIVRHCLTEVSPVGPCDVNDQHLFSMRSLEFIEQPIHMQLFVKADCMARNLLHAYGTENRRIQRLKDTTRGVLSFLKVFLYIMYLPCMYIFKVVPF